MIFIDTTVWVSAADRHDHFHPSACKLVDALLRGELPLALTTDFVLDETITILGRRKGFGAEKARIVGERIISSPRVIVVYVEESLLKEALKEYPQYKGKLSFTDTTSVIVMRKYGIREILSHDKDFDRIRGMARREDI